MRTVFVDSGGFFALLVGEDPFHSRAKSLFEQASTEKWQLVTSYFVVVETHALLLARTRDGREKGIAFLDEVERPPFRIEAVQDGDHETAVAILKNHQDKTYSLCDALSFVIMQRLGISEVIAFDRHFREYGRFTVL